MSTGIHLLNLVNLPISSISNSAINKTATELLFSKGSSKTLKIIPSSLHGAPYFNDDKVFSALLKLSYDLNYMTETYLEFSKSDLLDVLKMSRKGDNYTKIIKSLQRWSYTSLEFNYSLYEHNKKKWISDTISPIEPTLLHNLSRSKTKLAIRWSQRLISEVEQKYYRRINFDEYISIKSPIARRIYSFVGSQFYNKNIFEMPLYDFAVYRVGIRIKNPNRDTKLIQSLINPLKELRKIGFIEFDDINELFPPNETTAKTIRLISTGVGVSPKNATPRSTVDDTKDAEIEEIEALKKHGIKGPNLEKLITKIKSDSNQRNWVRQCVLSYMWVKNKTPELIKKNNAGYLYSMIEKVTPLSEDYLEDRKIRIRHAKKAQKTKEMIKKMEAS